MSDIPSACGEPCELPDVVGPCWGTVVAVGHETPPSGLSAREARRWRGPTVPRCAAHRHYERDGYRPMPSEMRHETNRREAI